MVRVFRADSPADVICAGFVRQTLETPGRAILALCTDKCLGDPNEMRACLHALARIYPWDQIVDVSDVPVNLEAMGTTLETSARARVRTRVRSVRLIRERLQRALGQSSASPEVVNEMYMTCPYHADVQAMYRALAPRRAILYPHGFGAFTDYEMIYYDPVFRPRPQSLSSRVKDVVLRVSLGPDAVPVRKIPLAAAFYSTKPAPWTENNHSLAHLETAATMRWLFESLPSEVSNYYRALASRCGPRTGLLILSGQSGADDDGSKAELEAHVHLAREMTAREGLEGLIVKPHPMNSVAWISTLLKLIRAGVGGVSVEAVERFHHYPIEVVVAPLAPLCTGTLISSSILNIKRMYGIRAYCPEEQLRYVWSHSQRGHVAEQWIEDTSPFYTAV